jgi:ZIP family zinc transporter
MLQALLLGFVSQSALLLSGLVVYYVTIPKRIVGWLAGFGAGALISAVAFDLIAQDQMEGVSDLEIALWLLIGALVFIGGDRLVESRFGDGGAGGALGIVLGAVVDAIPESIILGIQVALGIPVSAAFIFAVWISNIPQSLAPSVDLAEDGWSKAKVALMWSGVVVASSLAAGLGFLAASNISGVNGARMAALAAGGILAMLTNSLMPFAYERGGNLTGIWTVVGFAIAFAM